MHYVLPGFPSFEPLAVPGASCTPLEAEPSRLLRVRKDHHPCQGTEIAIQLEEVETGTRIAVVQSGFGAFLDIAGRNIVFGHGLQIVADLALYVERGVFAPGRVWGANLGATTTDRHYGLEIARVDAGGFAAKAGLETGDVLVSLRGVRVYDTRMLSTILALSEVGSEADVTWVRGRDVMSGKALF
jgi:S1-C subfamily serine protease